jgi:membrane-bound acyltransferase YfiQ involved in biofilm formation
MGEQDHYEVIVPKGKLKPKHLLVLACFGAFLYLLSEVLKSVFSSGLSNPNYAIIVIALILVVITTVTVYTLRLVSKENHIQPKPKEP